MTRGRTPRVIRYYWGQLALLVLGIAALLALVSRLGSGTGGALVSVVLGIVAAVGVSAGSLSAGRLRQSLNADLAAVAATIAPLKPSAGPRKGPQNVAILRLCESGPRTHEAEQYSERRRAHLYHGHDVPLLLMALTEAGAKDRPRR